MVYMEKKNDTVITRKIGPSSFNHGTPINIGHVDGQNDCINILSVTPVSYLINVFFSKQMTA